MRIIEISPQTEAYLKKLIRQEFDSIPKEIWGWGTFQEIRAAQNLGFNDLADDMAFDIKRQSRIEINNKSK